MRDFGKIIGAASLFLASLSSPVANAVKKNVEEIVSPCANLEEVLQAVKTKTPHICVNLEVKGFPGESVVQDDDWISVAGEIGKPDAAELTIWGVESVIADAGK